MGDLKKKIELAFLVYDIDKNGSIDQKEIATLIQALFELLNFDAFESKDWDSEEKAKKIMQKLDTNRDNLLSRNEFVEGCLHDPSICEILIPYS